MTLAASPFGFRSAAGLWSALALNSGAGVCSGLGFSPAGSPAGFSRSKPNASKSRSSRPLLGPADWTSRASASSSLSARSPSVVAGLVVLPEGAASRWSGRALPASGGGRDGAERLDDFVLDASASCQGCAAEGGRRVHRPSFFAADSLSVAPSRQHSRRRSAEHRRRCVAKQSDRIARRLGPATLFVLPNPRIAGFQFGTRPCATGPRSELASPTVADRGAQSHRQVVRPFERVGQERNDRGRDRAGFLPVCRFARPGQLQARPRWSPADLPSFGFPEASARSACSLPATPVSIPA